MPDNRRELLLSKMLARIKAVSDIQVAAFAGVDHRSWAPFLAIYVRSCEAGARSSTAHHAERCDAAKHLGTAQVLAHRKNQSSDFPLVFRQLAKIDRQFGTTISPLTIFARCNKFSSRADHQPQMKPAIFPSQRFQSTLRCCQSLCPRWTLDHSPRAIKPSIRPRISLLASTITTRGAPDSSLQLTSLHATGERGCAKAVFRVGLFTIRARVADAKNR